MLPIRTIAFIGTGIMGAPMAINLARAGFAVVAWNRTAERGESLAVHGIRVAKSPSDAMSGADATIVMLSTGPVIDEVLFKGGRASAPVNAMRSGSLMIVMSSIPVSTGRTHEARLAVRRIDYLDAPVSGGERGAIAGRLAIMVGGSAHAFERAVPIFSAMGHPTRIGDTGAGQLAKLANQIVVGITVAAVAEALHFAHVGGAEMGSVRRAIEGGFADSTVLRQHGVRMVEGNFVPGGSATYQLKDLRTARELALSLGLELPLLAAVEALFESMVANGDGALDHSGVIREIARRGPTPHHRG